MSRLPEKGEARASAAATNDRMLATVDTKESGSFDIGWVTANRRTGETDGEPEFAVRAIYGDLFDVGEMLAVSADVAEMFLVDIALERRDPLSAMLSLYLMAAGQGVLLERKRWEER